jgi:superfamily II DNA helicase RecQ
LPPEERDRIQRKFMENEIRVLVSTIAFGMGIDKQDIRGVVHYDMPKSLENFVQESGRCARDLTKKGFCHVFVNPQDFALQRKFVFGSVRENREMRKSLAHILCVRIPL